MFKQLKLAIGLAITATLVACGGGSDSGPAAPVASKTFYHLKALLATASNDTKTLSWTLTGTLKGVAVTGSGSVSQSALNPAVFEGESALARTIAFTGTTFGNGITEPYNPTATEYLESNYNPLGTVADDYQVVIGTPNIPLSIKVGDAGLLYTANTYRTSSKEVLTGTKTNSFVLEADTATKAILKFITIGKDNSGKEITSSTIVYRVGINGSITRIAETRVTLTDTLSITYE